MTSPSASSNFGASSLTISSNTHFPFSKHVPQAIQPRMALFPTCTTSAMKVGASVVVARRGGCSATFDELNKYFTMNNMPVASSQYWNSVHGREKGQAEQDLEGLQTMRVLARNMAFLMKGIALAKEKYGLPEKESWQPTHFIR